MWTPLNKSALPSPEEIVYANEAINAVEDAIRDAFELIESTKLRITAMKRDLEERRGWIAPIRKVPTEVLIDILLWASEMSDLAPIGFSAVCRLWRNLILATPKAWSFINLIRHYRIHVHLRVEDDYHVYFPGYTNTYFERSKPRLLHLRLPKAEGFYTKHSNLIIEEQAYRLQCLTTHAYILRDTQSAHQCQQFPHLKTLTFTKGGAEHKLDTSFNVSRFAALRTLRWPRCYPLTGASLIISPSNFPPLQNLSLKIGANFSCMNILQCCAATLKTLRIGHREGNTTTTPPLKINFPLLQFLTIYRTSHSLRSQPLVDAATPMPTSLVMGLDSSQIPAYFEADLRNVTHIQIGRHLQSPSACAQVRVLQMKVANELTESRSAATAQELEEIAGAYSSLEIIELSIEGGKPSRLSVMQQKVEECLGEARLKPKLLWTTRWTINLPGYEPENCGRAELPHRGDAWAVGCGLWAVV